MRSSSGLARVLTLALAAAVLAASAGAATPPRPRPLLVFAAASLTDALRAIGPEYTRQTGQPVTFSFAASSTLARQIEAGARADVFFSADTDWMDFLESRHLIDPATRRDVVGNRLALIALAGSRIGIAIRRGFDLAGALGASGRLAVGEPDSVPAGRYARDALRSLGVWPSVAGRLAPAENVRSALEYVARGEAPLGIVYATDALIEPRVRIVGLFPSGSHAPIEYPAAAVAAAASDGHGASASGASVDGGGADAARFVRYLGSAAAQRIFHKYGFRTH